MELQPVIEKVEVWNWSNSV